jgi:hypothetical protein
MDVVGDDTHVNILPLSGWERLPGKQMILCAYPAVVPK